MCIAPAGKGCVFTYDAVGSYERVGYSAQGSGATLVIPVLDNQLRSPSPLLLPTRVRTFKLPVQLFPYCCFLGIETWDIVGGAGCCDPSHRVWGSWFSERHFCFCCWKRYLHGTRPVSPSLSLGCFCARNRLANMAIYCNVIAFCWPNFTNIVNKVLSFCFDRHLLLSDYFVMCRVTVLRLLS